MSWATSYINELEQGKTVQFRPVGRSMQGKIESGQLVTIEPVRAKDLQKDDIVLCKVKGSQYLHLVKDIRNGRFLIGNNKGRINGWIEGCAIYGRCVAVE